MQWTSKLRGSMEANHQPFVWLTLCSLSVHDASPRARTVVLRELNEELGELAVCTSTTSDKWLELCKDARFELCVYFPETREQYRMRGNAVRMDQDLRVWNKLSEATKQSLGGAFGVLHFCPNLAVERLDLFTGTQEQLN